MKKKASLEKQTGAKPQKSTKPQKPVKGKEKGKSKAKAAIVSASPVKTTKRIAKTGRHFQERLHEVALEASDGVVRRADSYVQTASNRVREIEEMAHEAARKLEPTQPEIVVQSLGFLSDQIGEIADYFESRDTLEILDDTKRLVRNHPVTTLGALALVGIAAGRCLRAGNGVSEG